MTTVDVERLARVRDPLAQALPGLVAAWDNDQTDNIGLAEVILRLIAAEYARLTVDEARAARLSLESRLERGDWAFIDAFEAAIRAESGATLAALREVAAIVRRHTHQGLYAMTRFAGPHPESDCALCRALVAAGVLTVDEIGAGTRAALAATPAEEERT